MQSPLRPTHTHTHTLLLRNSQTTGRTSSETSHKHQSSPLAREEVTLHPGKDKLESDLALANGEVGRLKAVNDAIEKVRG